MSRANLVVLGGGEDQIPAYVEGRRLGYRIIGIDQRPDALGAALSDEFLCLTTRAPEAIAERLGDIDVAAVISPASDAAQASVAALSRHFGTAFQPSPLVVHASEDKTYFHSIVEGLGFPRYDHEQSDEIDELVEAAGRMAYPLVVKPTDSSGSKGLSCVQDPTGLRDAIIGAQKHSFCGEVIIEELIRGVHHSVECFARGGRPEFMVVTERQLTPLPHMISVSHLVPAPLGCEVRARLQDMITAILAELQHVAGPVNFDFILDPAGDIYFVEMGGRLGGNGMPLLARHAFGVNTVAAAIRVAAGQEADLVPDGPQRFVMLRILAAEEDGTLTGISGLAQARALPGVTELQVFKEPGDHVRRYTQAANKLGYLIVTAASREDLFATLETTLATLRFDIASDASSTGVPA